MLIYPLGNHVLILQVDFNGGWIKYIQISPFELMFQHFFLIYQCTNQFSIPFGVSKKPWQRKWQYCWIFQFSNQTFCSIIEIFRHRCGNKLLKNWYIVLITWPILSQFLTVITILTISTVVLKILALKIKKS